MRLKSLAVMLAVLGLAAAGCSSQDTQPRSAAGGPAGGSYGSVTTPVPSASAAK